MPCALKYGVPYEAFWKLNPKRLKPFQELYERNLKNEYDMIDYMAWRNGLYVVSAIAEVIDSKYKYPEKPLSIKKEYENKTEDEISAIKFGEFASMFNATRKQESEVVTGG